MLEAIVCPVHCCMDCPDTEAIPPGRVTFGRGFKESAVVSLTVSRS